MGVDRPSLMRGRGDEAGEHRSRTRRDAFADPPDDTRIAATEP